MVRRSKENIELHGKLSLATRRRRRLTFQPRREKVPPGSLS
jgi:hypothetical protein